MSAGCYGSERRISGLRTLHRKKPPRDFTEDAPFRQTTPPPVREEKSKPVSENLLAKPGFTSNGHSISFAGVFLFTTLVFFRPYELSPSLKFLSNAAFWIALATFLVFVITQLGLENTITVRTREVKPVFLLALGRSYLDSSGTGTTESLQCLLRVRKGCFDFHRDGQRSQDREADEDPLDRYPCCDLHVEHRCRSQLPDG